MPLSAVRRQGRARGARRPRCSRPCCRGRCRRWRWRAGRRGIGRASDRRGRRSRRGRRGCAGRRRSSRPSSRGSRRRTGCGRSRNSVLPRILWCWLRWVQHDALAEQRAVLLSLMTRTGRWSRAAVVITTGWGSACNSGRCVSRHVSGRPAGRPAGLGGLPGRCQVVDLAGLPREASCRAASASAGCGSGNDNQ
jgi:hypothetical protein